MLVVHHEAEDASANAAAEAVKRLPVRIHMKRRRLLLVKRAEGLEVGPGAPERKVTPNDVHDVVGRSDLLYGFSRDRGHNVIFRSFGMLGDVKFRRRKAHRPSRESYSFLLSLP